MNNPDLAEILFNAAFDRARTPRSIQYKSGVLAHLRFRINHHKPECPHMHGTPEMDAWFAGADEGAEIWKKHNCPGPGEI